jgi:hypothetical protein
MQEKTIYVVTDKDGIQPLGCFTKHSVALDYLKNEFPNSEIQTRTGIVWPDKTISIFDPRIGFKYEIDDDYSSEPTKKRNELLASALAKLTLEEREALGVYG